ncbi:MAG: Crp/Fnr family transcriptional regulator [Pseudomonadota bacterium]
MGASYQHFCDSQQNQLLAALPQEDLGRWQDRLELVELSLHQILCAVGVAPEYVYFPTTAIVSLMSLTLDGASAEVAVVGNDGVVGISSLLGADVAATDAVVQSAGRAYRVSARFVKNEIEHSCGVMKVVMRYAQSVLGQMAQTAVCNRYHSIDQQLCRRLLLGLDRLPSDELDMTHELAANLLGVRREGVTMAAHKLQEAGLIRYRRGHIVVLDRQRLEQKTCECYAVAKKEYRRLLPTQLAA